MPGTSELSSIWNIASKEFLDDVRSRRFLLIGIFYIGIGLILSGGVWYIYANGAALQVFGSLTPADVVLNIMSVANFMLTILAIIIASDSLSLEKNSRTLYQLLSKPVERRSVIIGKYLGALAIISSLFILSAIIAYVLTSVLTGVYPDVGHVAGIGLAILSMVLLFAVYVAVGILVSTVTKNPLLSIMASLVIWIGFTVIYIAGIIIGLVSAMGNSIASASGNVPVDTFSLYPWYAKIIIWIDPGSHNVMSTFISGNPSGLVSGLPIWANVGFLLAYACVLLIVSIVIFERQDL